MNLKESKECTEEFFTRKEKGHIYMHINNLKNRNKI